MTSRWLNLFVLALLSTVQCQSSHIDIESDNSTSTPSVVTQNGDVNGSSTESYQSTQFPIWNDTTTTSTSNHSSTTTTSTSTPTGTSRRPTTTSTHTPTTVTPTSIVTRTSTRPTTTAMPTTGTVPMPTLPPEPVAPSTPWNMNYSSKGMPCLMISFAGRIEIKYLNVLNETVTTGLDVPKNATVSSNSHCAEGQDEEVLILDIESSSVPQAMLMFTFLKNSTNKNDSTLTSLKLTLQTNDHLFPGLSPVFIGKMMSLSADNLSLFDTTPAHSYSCVSMLTANLLTVKTWDSNDIEKGIKSKSPFLSGTFETSDLKVQTFLPSDKDTNSFLPNIVCPQDQNKDVSSTIPITVGLVLLFLVIIVLIAYFIGRSRQQKNYATM